MLKDFKKIIPVTTDGFMLPNEEETRKRLYDSADKAIESTKLFCAVVEALNEGLIDTRLETRSGVVEVMNEYAQYLNYTKSNKMVWYNQSRSREGSYRIWFDC